MRKALLLALLTACAACSGNKAGVCVTDNDCYFGEVCRDDGYCGSPIVAIDTGQGADTGAESDGSTATDGSMSNSTPDSGGDHDDAAANDTGSNVPDSGGGDMGAAGACIVDPFDVCQDDEDPDNNSFPGVAFAPMTRGCQSSGFVPLDETVSGRQCALDPEDQYYITVVECDADQPGMIIEATLDVKDDCDPDLIFFDVEQIGTSCANPNSDSDKQLRCETLPDGRRRISVIWPGQNVPSVASIRYSIQTPDHQDVQFDYDLHVVIREP